MKITLGDASAAIAGRTAPGPTSLPNRRRMIKRGSAPRGGRHRVFTELDLGVRGVASTGPSARLCGGRASFAMPSRTVYDADIWRSGMTRLGRLRSQEP